MTIHQTLPVTIGDQRLSGDHRQFKSGAVGYYVGGKVVLEDGKRYQVSCNIVEIGSKPAATSGAAKGGEKQAA